MRTTFGPGYYEGDSAGTKHAGGPAGAVRRGAVDGGRAAGGSSTAGTARPIAPRSERGDAFGVAPNGDKLGGVAGTQSVDTGAAATRRPSRWAGRRPRSRFAGLAGKEGAFGAGRHRTRMSVPHFGAEKAAWGRRPLLNSRASFPRFLCSLGYGWFRRVPRAAPIV